MSVRQPPPEHASRQRQLREVLELSRAMLMAATAERWDEVSTRERQRQALLKAVFSEPIPAGESPALEALLHEILEVDGRLIAHSQAAKTVAAVRLRTLRAGSAAQQAYARFAPKRG